MRAQEKYPRRPHSLDLKTRPPARPPYSIPVGWQLVPLSLCSTQASSNHAQLEPANALPGARSGGSPIPPVTPPVPPAPSLALLGNIPLINDASSSDGSTAGMRTSTKEKVAVERGVGGGASSAGLDSAGASASSTKAVLASSRGAAALPAGHSPGHMGTAAGQQDGGSFMAAVARMEWIERQGNNDGMVNMEWVASHVCGRATSIVRVTGGGGGRRY